MDEAANPSGDEPGSDGIRAFLVGAVTAAVGMPLLVFIGFGEVSGFGWGVTVFLVVLQLLGAFAFWLAPRPQYQAKVKLRNDWIDKIGASWLMVCAGGALLGWMLTSTVPITQGDWRWVYGIKVVLTIVLPVLTAVPLGRYIPGNAVVAIPLLVFVTALPALTGLSAARDLIAGPGHHAGSARTGPPDYLRHTHRSL